MRTSKLARRVSALCLFAVALALAAPAAAQRATERFIPLGRSPGLSGTQTMIGTIEAVDQAARRFTVAAPAGSRQVEVAATTRVWLDRSKRRETSLVGSFADLRSGQRVEVRYRDPAAPGVADWVKVEVAGP